MALVPFAGAAVARAGVFALAAAVVRVMSSRIVQAATVGAALTDLLNFDFVHKETLKIADPGSDPAAVQESAKMAARMLGLDGSTLWPRHRYNGQPITPHYFHVDLFTGKAWLTDQYISKKSLRMARGRRRFGFRRAFYRRSGTPTVVRNG